MLHPRPRPRSCQTKGTGPHSIGSGLPPAPVNDIRSHAPTRTVYAATCGRGIWSVQLSG